MTINSKQELISKIVALLNELIDVEEKTSDIPTTNKKLEMLTVKECAELVNGLSEHTVRQLIMQGKIPYVRAGKDKNGKILIAKSALMSYIGS